MLCNPSTHRLQIIFQYINKYFQVLNIKWRQHFDFLLPYSMADFICSHDSFVHPEYVLKDNVSLFFLLDAMAVFAEAEPDVQIWRGKNGAFIREASEHLAKKLICMPLSSLETLGESVGPPSAKICFLINTSRCGSTILTQILENTDKCVAISEPDGLNILAKMYREKGDSPQLRSLTTNYINLLCKPVKSPADNQAFFIKLATVTAIALPFFRKLYADANYLFMYRNVTDVAKSGYKITQVMPLLLTALYLGCFSETVVKHLLNELGISGEDFKMRYKDFLSMGTSAWCISTRQYFDLRANGVTGMRCLRYEDLIADPVYVIKEVLKHCKLPEELAELGVEAMKQPSQRKSLLNEGYRFKAPELTEKSRKNMNEILQRFRLPTLEGSEILEGIIGHKDKKHD